MQKLKHSIYKLRILNAALKFLLNNIIIYLSYKKTNRTKYNQIESIVHVNTHDGKGGAARVALDLIFSMKNNIQRIEFFVGDKKSNRDFVVEFPETNKKVEEFLQEAHKRSQWLDVFFPKTTNKKIIQRLNEFDIIHLHNLHGNYFSIFTLLMLKPRKKMVWTLHDMQAITGHCAHAFSCEKWQNGCGSCPDLMSYPALKKDTTRFLWKLKKSIYKKLDLEIIVPSNWLKEKVEKSSLKEFPIHVIYNGVDTSIFKPFDKPFVRNLLGLPLDKKIVLFSADMGFNNPYKGGEYVNQMINDDLFHDVLFINIGGEQLVKNQNLWTFPYIDDQVKLVHFYNAADVLLYPSLADNCPLVVLEAMACGLPIVAFNVGGIPELIENHKSGFVVPKEYDYLKNFTTRLLNNEVLRKSFSENSIKTVKSKFSIEKMNIEYLKVYNNVV